MVMKMNSSVAYQDEDQEIENDVGRTTADEERVLIDAVTL